MPNPEHLMIISKGLKKWNTWRKERPRIKPDLSDADLRQLNLRQADLIGVDLGGADLSDTDLTGAVLIGADLTGAELIGANLSEAYVSNVDFRRSCFGYTDLSAIDFSEAKGLMHAIHAYPSSVGIDTLYKSHGDIPDEFLRGAGVPEEVIIQWLPSIRSGSAIQFYSCFISYSHADKAFARRLHDALQGRGIRCWLDEHQLLPGDQVHRAVDEAVRLWDKVLLCCSEASLQSWWVDKEIQKALMKEEQLWKERGKETLAIIPLNLDGHLFSPEWKAKKDWKEQHLTTRLAANFAGWEQDNAKFEAQFERVVKALRADTAARQPAPIPKL